MSESRAQRFVDKEGNTSTSNSRQQVPPTPVKSSTTSEFSKDALPVTLPAYIRKSLTLSPLYTPSIRVKYIDQCFDDVKYLAEGSFGKVFEARSKDDGKLYAVKKFKKKFSNKKQRNIRLGEVHRYASIPQSRFCVELIRAWEEDAYLFFQMELCSVTVNQYIAKRGLSEELIWKILFDLILAVKHLHSNEFVHLDIKPDNILVSPDDTFKLADFGLMLDLSKGPVTDADEGDARYLPPEVLQGVFTKAADIFSLGISLFEIGSAKQLPSHGDLWHELRSGVLPFCRFSCKYPDGGFSKELLCMIQAMMAPVPEDRPSVNKLLKYDRLAKMYRRRCFQFFLDELAIRMKTIYGKVMAVRCGLLSLKPVIARLCSQAWKRRAAQCLDSGENCQWRQEPPRLIRPYVNPNAPEQHTEEEERLFRVRLAACKKRLTFDDEEPTNTSTTTVAAIDQPSTSNGITGSSDTAVSQQSSPKRRRLFD